MVFIDTEGLRRLGAALDRLSDDLVPGAGADVGGCGFPELAAACSTFEQARQHSQLQAARQVQALAVAVGSAAREWERTEQLLGRH